ITKTPSTLDDQSRGLVDGIAGKTGDFSAIRSIIHGTTAGTNAMLERKGAVTGIITTEGFCDVLEMRRRDRPYTWGLWGQFEPVVRRDRRVGVVERTHADGTVVCPADPHEVKKQAKLLLDRGCVSVCIFFINSYANDDNERAAAEAVREIWPNNYVTRATEILPEIREFERLSTGTLNAYLQPVVSSYLDRLDDGLSKSGFRGDLLIVQSNGGVMSVETAKDYPVRTALSGPAAGVRAAQTIARASGFDNVITCDLGGTSFDVSLIANGQAALNAQSEIGFGMVIRTPMIEITTIGAGGGSIARIDAGGLLQVGPESAGSNPGPVCYGLGNTEPTLTDANLVLGRINAERPIGGKIERLDVEGARAAIQAKIAGPLKLSVEDAAEAILRVANAKMAGAIRLVSIERGHDPAKFSVMPFGGGGSLHAGALIQECGLQGALVPRYPGVTSALGCVVADMRHDHVKTVNQLLSDSGVKTLSTEMLDVAGRLSAMLEKAGVPFDGVEHIFEFDMLYVGQTHTVSVPLQITAEGLTRESVQAAFETAYKASFGRLLASNPTRIMNFRVAAVGRRPEFDMSVFAPAEAKQAAACKTGTRQIYVAGNWHEADIYDRLPMAVGEQVVGPCILEQLDTTIFIDPGLKGRVDPIGNLIIGRVQ
ncbi:MAG: hydantoinase/oxoprolinase family protein, partial [Rhodobacteraceae bacterium]|nr:hydantoinase/oxoprolinase family protein [Paracoccaceae bacterium]